MIINLVVVRQHKTNNMINKLILTCYENVLLL